MRHTRARTEELEGKNTAAKIKTRNEIPAIYSPTLAATDVIVAEQHERDAQHARQRRDTKARTFVPACTASVAVAGPAASGC